MTHSAQAFLGPLTLQTLTRRRPMTDPLELLPDQRIAHIVAADSADLILVAPATARWMAAMAAGLADDVITATCLASAAPVVVAPAMDGEMYAPSGDASPTSRSCGRSATRSSSRSSGRSPRARSGRGRLAEPADDPRRGRSGARRTADPPARSRRSGHLSRFRRRARTWTAGTSSSRPAARPSRSTRCATSAIARPARWASRSRRPRWRAARE